MNTQELIDLAKRGYSLSGLKPNRGSFLGTASCCPLTAMCIAEMGMDFVRDYDLDVVFKWAGDKFGQQWFRGFWAGADALVGIFDDLSDEFCQGYRAGREVAEALGL